MVAARARPRGTRRVLRTVVHRRRRDDRAVPSRADAACASVRAAAAHAAPPSRASRTHRTPARLHLRRGTLPRGRRAPRMAAPRGARRRSGRTCRSGLVWVRGAD